MLDEVNDEGFNSLLQALFRRAVFDLRSQEAKHRHTALEFLRGSGACIAQELGADASAWYERVDELAERVA